MYCVTKKIAEKMELLFFFAVSFRKLFQIVQIIIETDFYILGRMVSAFNKKIENFVTHFYVHFLNLKIYKWCSNNYVHYTHED